MNAGRARDDEVRTDQWMAGQGQLTIGRPRADPVPLALKRIRWQQRAARTAAPHHRIPFHRCPASVDRPESRQHRVRIAPATAKRRRSDAIRVGRGAVGGIGCRRIWTDFEQHVDTRGPQRVDARRERDSFARRPAPVTHVRPSARREKLPRRIRHQRYARHGARHFGRAWFDRIRCRIGDDERQCVLESEYSGETRGDVLADALTGEQRSA